MPWHYRIVKRQDPTTAEISYGIHEYFYDVDETSKDGWTTDPVPVVGESLEGLKWILERMLQAFDRPLIQDTKETVDEHYGRVDE